MICKRVQWIILPVFLLITSSYSLAQNNAESARQASMAHSYATLDGFWSLHGNPAGLTNLKNPAVGLTIENRFFTKDLNRQWIGFASLLKNDVWGISASRFGNSLFNRQEISGAFARKFGENFSAGLKFDYHRIALAENYGSSSAFTFDLGIQTTLSDKFILGTHLYNPVQAKYNSDLTETIPSAICAGIRYKLERNFHLFVEVEKMTESDASVKCAFAYEFDKFLSIRGGYATQPETFAFGINLNWQAFEFDFGSSWHHYLGYSPTFSLIWQI